MWEIVFSADLLVGLPALQFKFSVTNSEISPNSSTKSYSKLTDDSQKISQHPESEPGTNCQSSLNNLRLIIQPLTEWYLIEPGLRVFRIPGLKREVFKLIEIMNFRAYAIEYAVAN